MLLRAASKLQMIKDNWEQRAKELSSALYYNRKLWTVLTQSVSREENPLPVPIKQNIANLGLFIFKRTLETELSPEPDKLTILISINREIAAGLSAGGR